MNTEQYENGYKEVGYKRGFPAKIYYEIFGNRNAMNKIVFVNGLGQPTSSWKLQVEYFKKKKDFQFCVFDNRGVGKSTSITVSAKNMALDVIELVKLLNWKKVNFVGVSIGGSACLYIASLIEEELINSVLVSGAIIGLFQSPPLASIKMTFPYFIINRQKRIESWNNQLFSNKFLNSSSTTNPKLTNNELLIRKYLKSESVILYKPKNILAVFFWFYTAVTIHFSKSLRNDIANKKYAKIGIIACKHDYIIKMNNLKRFSREINTWKLYVADSGHLVNIEKSDYFNSTIIKHIHDSNSTNDFSNNIKINSKL
ncbi:hypothetical protein ACTA71_008567 [Dictyostelium dimigraforme]